MPPFRLDALARMSDVDRLQNTKLFGLPHSRARTRKNALEAR